MMKNSTNLRKTMIIFCCTLKDGHKRLQDILYLIDLSPAAMITFAYTTILREMHLKLRQG